jgi:ArsR family transcriptional regulator, arsenate/arsenite/antimonite-responsive transcriptional repressor
MNKKSAVTIFESLSSAVRLDVYRLLIGRGGEGMVAGEIASKLDVPSTNLSFHLKALVHAGLISVEQEGRFQRYRANLPLMLELIAYLTDECCGGKPEMCGEFGSLAICPRRTESSPEGAENHGSTNNTVT